MAKQTVRSPKFARLIEKQVARKLIVKASELDKQQVDAEIDGMPERELQAQAAGVAMERQGQMAADADEEGGGSAGGGGATDEP
jgi:hypothetical protein